jgi:hypothetical protein
MTLLKLSLSLAPSAIDSGVPAPDAGAEEAMSTSQGLATLGDSDSLSPNMIDYWVFVRVARPGVLFPI